MFEIPRRKWDLFNLDLSYFSDTGTRCPAGGRGHRRCRRGWPSNPDRLQHQLLRFDEISWGENLLLSTFMFFNH